MPEQLPNKKKFILIREAAEILDVSIDTIRRWDQQGKLSSVRLDGKNRYFERSAIEALKKQLPLTISQVATQLGISASTLRRLEQKGLISSIRNSRGERLYDPQTVTTFLAASKKKSQTPKIKAIHIPSPIAPITEAPFTSEQIHELYTSPKNVHYLPEKPVFEPKVTSNAQVDAISPIDKDAPTTTIKTNAWVYHYGRTKDVFAAHKGALFLFLFCIILTLSFTGYSKYFEKTAQGLSTENTAFASSGSQVLAEQTQRVRGSLSFNIPSVFNADALFKSNITVEGLSLLRDDLTVETGDINVQDGNVAVSGTVTASNLIYSVTGGENVTVTGGQNPIISVDLPESVLSFQGETGEINLTAGSGIGISGLTISNTDGGSAQNIFKTISVDGTDIVASSNTDILRFVAGSGVLLSTDTSNNQITISSDGLSPSPGWADDGSVIRLITNTDSVGVGTTTPGAKIESQAAGIPQLRLSYDGSAYVNFQTDASGNLAIGATGSQVNFSGLSVSAADFTCADCLDFSDFGDTLTLDANLVINPTGSNYTIDIDNGTLFVDSANNRVGIGTTTPGQALDIAGNIQISGTTTLNGQTYTWPNNSGSAGYVLATNGAGALYWEDVAGATGGQNYFDQSNGLLSPKNATVDFAIGGSSTASAAFAVTNVNDGTPQMTLSDGSSSLYLTATGSISTTNNADIVLGSATSGDITLYGFVDGILRTDASGNITTGAVNLASATEITGILPIANGGTGANTLNNLITLGTHTVGNYVATITNGNGITGASTGEGAALTLAVNLTTSGDTINTSSNSGLEVSPSGLSLLRGCDNGQILKWNESTGLWECSADVGGLSTAVVNIQEGDVTVTSTADTLDFSGTDFSITESPAGEVNIALDYANSGITRSGEDETISGNWVFSNTLTANIINLTSELQTGGTLRIDASGNLSNIGTTELNGITYTWPTSITDGYVLSTNGLGELTWSDPASFGTNYFQRNSGAIAPLAVTDDLLLGANATSSALVRLGGTSGTDSFINTGGNVGIGTSTNLAQRLTVNGAIGTVSEGDIFSQYDGDTATWYPVFARYWDANGTYESSTFVFGNGTNAVVGIEKPGGGNVSLFRVRADLSEFAGSILINGDTISDFTGTGLTNNAGSLEATLGTTVDLTSEVTGILPVANGGTGANTLNNLITLATHTTGNYVATVTGNTQIGVSGSGSENAGVTLAINANSIGDTQLEYNTGQNLTTASDVEFNSLEVTALSINSIQLSDAGTDNVTSGASLVGVFDEFANSTGTTVQEVLNDLDAAIAGGAHDPVTLTGGHDYLTLNDQEITLNAIDLTTDVTGILPIANGGTGSNTLNNLITLATHTTGNYVATVTGNTQIGVSGSGSENAAVTLSINANSIGDTQLEYNTGQNLTTTSDVEFNSLEVTALSIGGIDLSDTGTDNITAGASLVGVFDEFANSTGTTVQEVLNDLDAAIAGGAHNPVTLAGSLDYLTLDDQEITLNAIDLTTDVTGILPVANGGTGANTLNNLITLGTHTTGNYVATVTGNTQIGVSGSGSENASVTLSINANSIGDAQLEYNTGQNLTTTSDVTFANLTATSITLGSIGLEDVGSDNITSGASLVGVFDEFTNSNGTTVQAVLNDLDAAVSGASHNPVTLAGSLDYLTLDDQEITLNAIDLTTDVTGILPVANGGTGANTLNNLITLGTHTTGNYVATVTGNTQIGVSGSGSENASVTLSINANSIGDTQLEFNTGQNLTTTSDVEFNTLEVTALSIGGIDLSDTGTDNITSGASLVGIFDEFANSNGTTVQAVLNDLDAAIAGGAHNPVTLAGSFDYLTLDDQEITLNAIDLTTDVTGILPVANGGTGANTLNNLITLGTHTTGNYVATVTGNTQIGVSGSGSETATVTLSINADSIGDAQLEYNTGQNLTTTSNVEFNTLTLNGIGLDDSGTDNITSGASLIGVFDEFTNSNSTTVQAVLNDLDAAVTGAAHSPVTLAGTLDYLTLDDQEITLNAIDLTTDVTGILPVANGGTGANTLNNLITLGTHTTGNYVATVTGNTQIGVSGSGSENAAVTLSINANSIGDTQLAFNTGQNLTTTSDVEFNSLEVTALSIGGIDLSDVGTDNITSGATLVGVFDEFVNSSSTTVQGVLNDLDAAIASGSHDPVTLAGSLDYLTLSGQQITLNAIDLATDVTGILPVANGGTGANTLNNLITLGTHTTGNYVATVTGNTQIGVSGSGSENAAVTLSINANSIGDAQLEYNTGQNLTTTSDVTFANLTATSLTIGSIGLEDVGSDNVTSGASLVGVFDEFTNSSATTVQGVLADFDTTISNIHNPVTFAGTYDYLTLDDQEITLNAIDLTTDVTGILPVANGGTGANTLNNLITLGTHTTGNYVATITGNTQIGVTGSGSENASITLSLNADSIGDAQLEYNTGQNLTTTSDVTFANLTATSLTLGSIGLEDVGSDNITSGASLVGVFDEFTNSDGITIQQVLNDLDAAVSGSSHDPVTLAGSLNYLTLDDQEITLNAIDLTTDVTGILPIANGGTGANTLNNLIALGTHTTGNYVATITGNTQIGVSGSGSENAGVTLSINANSIGDAQLEYNTGQDLTTTSSPTFNELTLTTLTISGDSITDFVGSGLTLNSGVLETILGSDVDLASEVTGTLPVSNGGTGATSFTAGGILYGAGTSPVGVSAQGTSGQVLVSGGSGAPTWVDSGTVGTNYWQYTDGALAPVNTSDDILLGSNATASARIRFAGTTNEDSFFNTGGNLGIGTTTPLARLDVRGGIRLGANADADNILNTSAAAGAPSGYLYWGDRQLCDTTGNCAGSGGGLTGSGTANYIAVFTGSGTLGDSTIYDDNGNIGIGTTNPAAVLDVNGTANFTGLATFAAGVEVNGDTITDFVGTGLTLNAGSLETTLGTSVDLTSEVTGILPVANGGTGSNTLNNLITLGTHTTGNYVATITGNTQIGVSGSGSENASVTLAINADSIGDSQLEYNTGQDLTTTSDVIFNSLEVTALSIGGIDLSDVGTDNVTSGASLVGVFDEFTYSSATTVQDVLDDLDAALAAAEHDPVTLTGSYDYLTLSDQEITLNAIDLTTDVTGILPVANGGTGANTLNNLIALGTHTTGNYVATITGNSQISVSGSGSETAGVTLSIAADSIGDTQLEFNTGQNLTTASTPAFSGLTLGGGFGSTGISFSAAGDIQANGDLTIDGTTTFNGVEYTWPGADAGVSGYVLSSNAAGQLSWIDIGSATTQLWAVEDGALFPTNSTLDFFMGGQASDSAKFAVLNMNSGIPTASLSAGLNSGTYLTANGTLATSAMQNLTFGTSATGDVIFNNGGNVGIGTATPVTALDVTGGIRLGDNADADNILNTSAAGGAPSGFLYWGNRTLCDSSGNCAGAGGGITGSGTENMVAKFTDTGAIGDSSIFDNGNVGIGNTSPTVGFKLDVTGGIRGTNGLTITSGTVSLPAGEVDNSELANDSITVTAGTGLSGGGTVALGSSISLDNEGVLSFQGQTGVVTLTAGTGIDISGTTISNDGVIDLTGTTNQVSVSASTGSITLSLPQDIDTAADVEFGSLTINTDTISDFVGTGLQLNTGVLSTTLGTDIDLTAEVTGVLPVANGGTGANTLNNLITLGTHTTGNYVATVTGNTQIGVSGSGSENASVTLSINANSIGDTQLEYNTGQNLTTTSTPTFSTLSLTSLIISGDTINDFAGTGLQVTGNVLSTTLGTSVDLATEVTGTLPVGNGGTGVTSLSNVLGTTNQVSVSNGTGRVIGGDVTLSLPQNIDTGADVEFGTLTLSGIGLADTGTDNETSGAYLVGVYDEFTNSDATSVQQALADLDAAIVGNAHDPVTLAGSLDYLTLSGQQITLNAIDLTTDVTGILPVANGGTGANTLNNLIALGTHTTGNYVATVTGNTQIGVSGSGSENAGVTLSINANSIGDTQLEYNTGQNLTTTSDVTFANLTATSLTLGSIGLEDVGSDNVTSGASLVGVFDEFTNSDATTVQEALADLDSAITGTSHSPITLAGAYDYLTLSGQEITLNAIDLTTDVTGILPVANGGTGANTLNNLITLGTHTTGNYVATVTGNTQIGVSGSGSENAAVTLSINADSIGDSQLEYNTGQNLTTTSDVEFNSLEVTALTIGGIDLSDAGTDNITSGASLVGVFDEFTNSTGTTVQEVLADFDAALSGAEHDPVTFAGTYDYLTLSDQEITLNAIDLTTDVTGILPVANGGTGANTLNNLITLGTHTTGNYVATVTGNTQIGVSGSGSENASITLSINANSIGDSQLEYNTGQNLTTTSDVTFANLTATSLTIGSIGLEDVGTDNITSGASLIGVFDEFANSNGTTVQAVLNDLDAAISGNEHDPVTLAGSYDYLTLSDQQITLGQIDLTTDVTGILPVANGGTGANTLNNLITLGTHTTGNYVATIAGNSQISVSGSGSETAAVSLSITADSIGDSQLAFNTGQNLTTTSDVEFNSLTLGGIGLADVGTDNITSGASLVGVFDEFTNSSGVTVQEVLADFDAALAGAEHDPVTLAGTLDYLSINDQEITLNAINLTTDVTGILPVANGGTGSNTLNNLIALGTHTTGNYVATVTGNTQIGVSGSGSENAGVTLSINANSIGDTQLEYNTGQNLTTTSDVTFANLTATSLTVGSIGLEDVGSDNITSGASLVGVFDEFANSNGTTVQAVLNDLDAAIASGAHDPVTLAGSLDYLTLSGQEITLNAIDLTTDVTGILPVANGGTGANTLNNLIALGTHTTGNYVATVTGNTQIGVSGSGSENAGVTLSINANSIGDAQLEYNTGQNLTTTSDVEFNSLEVTALSIGGIDLSDVGTDNITSGASLVGVFDEFTNSSATTVQGVLADFDTALSSAHDAVTLAGSLDYLTLNDQEITLNAIDLTTDVTGILPVANGGTGATTLNNLITLGTHTTGNYVATVTGNTQIGVSGSGSENASVTLAINADSIGDAQLEYNTGQNLTTTSDVEFNSLEIGTLTIGGIDLASAGTDNITSGASLVGVFDEFANSAGTNVQDVLDDLDAAISGATHDAVTLAGSYDYLTLSDQQITLGQIDLTTDVTGILPVANGGTGANTLNNLITLGTHTTGNYVATVTGNTQIGVSGSGSETAGVTLSINANSIGDTQLEYNTGQNLTTTSNVTFNTLTLGSIGLEDAGTDNITSGASLIGVFDEFTNSSSTTVQAVLNDFDTAISGATHNAVTLAGSLDYLTLSGQEITLNAIDLTTDVTGILPVANGGTGANTLNNLITLGTHTTGNYVATVTGNTQIGVSGSGSENAGVTLAINADSIGDAQLEYNTGQNLTTTSDVEFNSLEVTALSVGGIDLSDAGTDNVTSGASLVGVFDEFANSNSTTLQAVLNDLDSALSDATHDAVTLAGSLDYLTLSGQEITLNAIDLTTDVTGILPVANGGTGANTLNNLITLGTHTTGNYVATITGNTQIGVSGSGSENAAVTLSLNADSIGDAQLEYNTGQNLTTTSTPTFSTLSLTSLIVSGDTINDFAGAGLQVTGNVLSTTLGTSVDLASEVTGTLPTTSGGTGLTSYTTGDLIYASATNTLAKRAIGNENDILYVNSSGIPAWGTPGSLGINVWQRDLGAIAPLNISDDVLVGHTATASARVRLPGTNNQDAWFNLGSGNVGIGDTTPTYKLDVNGTIRTTGKATMENDQDVWGTLCVGTFCSNNGTVQGGSNLTLQSKDNGYIRFNITSGNEVARITEDGLAIGTTTPGAYLLNVNGDGNISGDLTIGNDVTIDGITTLNSVSYTWPASQAGGTDYILVNDGAGELSWMDPGDLPNNDLWQQLTGAIAPVTLTDDVLVGDDDAATATVKLPGSTNEDGWFNFGTGNLGVGTTGPDAKVDILGTTQQLRLTHTDSTYYAGFTVDGTGKLTIATQTGLELTGGTLTASDFSCSDCLDFAELADTMTLDADWALTTGSYDVNFGAGNFYIDATNGNVGIGTTAPAAKLDVDFDPGTFDSGISNALRVEVTGEANVSNNSNVRSLYFSSEMTGANNASELTAIAGDVYNDKSSGAITTQQGMSVSLRLTGAGNTTNAYGFRSIPILNDTGSITSAYRGFEARTPSISSSGTIDTAYGFYSHAQSTSGVTNAYGFYQAGSSDINYFAGNVGIGVTNPGSELVIGGTTPFITIGDAGAEDAGLIFDGNAVDFHMGLDDSLDTLVFGTGSTLGSSTALSINSSGNIGIGTTSPAQLLGISSTGDAAINLNASSISTSSTDTGVVEGTTAVETNNILGTVAWTAESDAFVSNNTYASAAFTSAQDSEYLNLQGFNFSIPSGSTIDGIVVRIERDASLTGGVEDEEVRLLNDSGSAVGTDKANTGSEWGTTETTITYGGSSDTWSSGLTADQINDPDFGVRIVVMNDDTTNRTAYIDNVDVRVYYTTPSSANWTFGVDDTNGSYKLSRSSSLTSNTSMMVDLTGRIGFGTTASESRVQISGGGLCVGSDANCNADNNTEGVIYSSSTAMTTYDVAENYPTQDMSVGAQDVVVLDEANGVFVKKSSGNSNELPLGVISTKPGVLLGGFNGAEFAEERQVAVGLSGRIPVKVTSEGGDIKIGDPLTISSTPGAAKKITTAGWIVGRALGNYSNTDTNAIGSVMMFINPVWYDPAVQFASDGTLELAQDIQNNWLVLNGNGDVAGAKGAYSELTVANLAAGEITTEDIFATNLVATAGMFDNLNASFLASDDISINNTLSAGKITTDEIDMSDFRVIADESMFSLSSSTATEEALFSVDMQGNAEFAGSVTTPEIIADSGTIDTLTVTNLIVENISGLTASSSAFFNLGAGVEADFAEFDFTTINADLTVLGTTTLREAAITESLAIGAGELVINSSSINTLSETFEIQSLAQAPVSIMAGAVIFNTDGTVKFAENVEFEKDIAVKGEIVANVIKGVNDVLNVSGSATFEKFGVEASEAELVNLTTVNASGSAGLVTLKANQTQLKVNNDKVTEDSLIFITPVGSTGGEQLYIKQQVDSEYFIVEIENAITNDVKFNFLIVN